MHSIYGLIEIGLNRYLSVEPEALAACARLAGRVLAFHLSDLGLEFHLSPDATGMRVIEPLPERPDVRLSAGTATFIRLLTAGEERQALLTSGAIQVEGDAALADRFTRMLESARPDPEEILAPLMGDVLAYRAGRFGRGLLDWGRHAAATLAGDTTEYLREESGDLVHRNDAEDWMSGVDEVSEDLARLTARVQRLEKTAGSREQ